MSDILVHVAGKKASTNQSKIIENFIKKTFLKKVLKEVDNDELIWYITNATKEKPWKQVKK